MDNPEVDNPEVDNTALLEGGGTITDITWTISNVGNTTTAYNLNVFLNGTTVSPALELQLLIYRRYRTPAIAYNSCDLKTIARTSWSPTSPVSSCSSAESCRATRTTPTRRTPPCGWHLARRRR